MAIAFSYSGLTQEVLDCTVEAQRHNCPVVAVTKVDGSSKLATMADAVLGVEAARKEPLQEAPDLAPEHHDSAQYGGGVERHVEREVFFQFHAEQLLGDLQVAAARNGQEFRNALHDTEQDGL